MQKKADRLRDLLRLARVLRTAAGEGPHRDNAGLFAQTAEALERHAQELAYGQPALASARPPAPTPVFGSIRAIDLVC